MLRTLPSTPPPPPQPRDVLTAELAKRGMVGWKQYRSQAKSISDATCTNSDRNWGITVHALSQVTLQREKYEVVGSDKAVDAAGPDPQDQDPLYRH